MYKLLLLIQGCDIFIKMAAPAIQQFCLRWNNHQPNFISVFSSLLNNESLVDVTLAAEGKHVQAHKIVLSACSTYFQSLFTVNPCQHPIVILKDIKYSDLKIIIDFMYCGEVNVSQEQLPAILKTAETLKIKGLAEMPEHNIHLSVCSDKTSEPQSPSPSMLRRKRLRKSSTGSGSGSTEHATTGGSEETVGSGVPSPSNLKVEQHSEAESSLRNDPSTESEPGFASQESVEDENTPSLHQQSSTEEGNDTGMKSSASMEEGSAPSASSSQQHYPSADAPGGGTMGSKRGRLLMRQHRIKKESDLIQGFDGEGEQPQLSPLPAGASVGGGGSGTGSSSTTCTSVSVIPRVIERQCSEPVQSHSVMQPSPNLLSVPQPSFLVKQHSSPVLLSSTQSSTPTLHVHLVTPSASEPAPSNVTVRAKDELRRTASSPQCSTSSASELTESRSCHCPVLRPGPALGCNFCWNTIDAHGRILRRKTKYHCPECQTNLCIVPCFQEYHERHSSEARVVVPLSSGSTNNSNTTVVPAIMKTSSM